MQIYSQSSLASANLGVGIISPVHDGEYLGLLV